MCDRKQIIKDILDRECMDELSLYKKGCEFQPFRIRRCKGDVNGELVYTIDGCWHCHVHDKVTAEIIDVVLVNA
jgi:hypothetical protein